jgi:hypothetical protein
MAYVETVNLLEIEWKCENSGRLIHLVNMTPENLLYELMRVVANLWDKLWELNGGIRNYGLIRDYFQNLTNALFKFFPRRINFTRKKL